MATITTREGGGNVAFQAQALTRALTGRGASKYCPFMIEIPLPTDKVLIAEKNSGLTPVGAETIDGSPASSAISHGGCPQ